MERKRRKGKIIQGHNQNALAGRLRVRIGERQRFTDSVFLEEERKRERERDGREEGERN